MKSSFLEIDAKNIDINTSGLGPSLAKEVLQLCSVGKVVVFKGLRLNLDLDNFMTDKPVPNEICKIRRATGDTSSQHRPKLEYICSPGKIKPLVTDDNLDILRSDCFKGSWNRLNDFLDNFELAEEQMRRVVRQVLEGYDYQKDWGVWRLNLGDDKKIMHYDPSPDPLKFESLRVFLNVDEEERLWRISHSLLESYEKKYDSLLLHSYNNWHEVLGTKHLRKALRPNPKLSPTLDYRFQPGDLWMFDGRLVSHQVLEGFKALSLTTRIGLGSIQDSERTLGSQLTRLEDRLSENRFRFKRSYHIWRRRLRNIAEKVGT